MGIAAVATGFQDAEPLGKAMIAPIIIIQDDKAGPLLHLTPNETGCKADCQHACKGQQQGVLNLVQHHLIGLRQRSHFAQHNPHPGRIVGQGGGFCPGLIETGQCQGGPKYRQPEQAKPDSGPEWLQAQPVIQAQTAMKPGNNQGGRLPPSRHRVIFQIDCHDPGIAGLNAILHSGDAGTDNVQTQQCGYRNARG